MQQFNPKGLAPADPIKDGSKILQRADMVWSRMTLGRGEILLVKVSKHLTPHLNDVAEIVHRTFKGMEEKVLVYVDGDIEFTKVSRETPTPGN